MPESIDQKADRYLTEGRVCVRSASPSKGLFQVAGREVYEVKYTGTMWTCSCPAHVAVCAHVRACQKVSKFDTLREVLFTSDPEIDALLGEI